MQADWNVPDIPEKKEIQDVRPFPKIFLKNAVVSIDGDLRGRGPFPAASMPV